VHALSVYPRRLPFQGLIAVTSWAVGIGFIVTVAFNPIPRLWWWVQGLQLSYFAVGWLLRRLSRPAQDAEAAMRRGAEIAR